MGGGVRYFEKENGGVSTALNLGIKNMRGKYFSWLSHDDIYLPEKVQVEIDALREAGDMSRVVFSETAELIMPERKIVRKQKHLLYRQSFFENGAVASFFRHIGGCSLLIPKFYFDVYGGFDENLRGLQDCKRWFETFRGKRLIYVPVVLCLGRVHSAQQTNQLSSMLVVEDHWLNHWMMYNLHKDDFVGSGITDLYHFYSVLFTIWIYDYHYFERIFLIQKIMELPESPDADTRAQMLSNSINDGKFQTYLPAEQEELLRHEFALRGITLGGNVKFVPFAQFPTIKPEKNVRILNRDSLLQSLIDTPIRKNIFAQWLNMMQGGQQA